MNTKGKTGKIAIGRRKTQNASPFGKAFLICGAEWTRTTDSRIFSPMLYHLSYSTPIELAKVCNSLFTTKIIS